MTSNVHRNFDNLFHDFKVVRKKVITTASFNVDFHNIFINFGLFVFSTFPNIYIYIINKSIYIRFIFLMPW